MQELPIRLSPGPLTAFKLTPFRILVILQQVLQRTRSRTSRPKNDIPNYCPNVNPAIGLWPEAGNNKERQG